MTNKPKGHLHFQLLVNSGVAICFTLLLFLPAHATQNDIKKQQRALEKLRNEIEHYEQKIRSSEQQEKATLERLDDIEKQSNLIKSFLQELVNEEDRLHNNINATEEKISFSEKQLTFLKQHYANYVTSVYKYGRVYDFETLLSSKSINQLYIRIEYFKRFSAQRQKDLQSIIEKKDQIEDEQTLLQYKLDEERRLITEKQSEEKKIHARRERRQQVLADIRGDKTAFQKELLRKTQAAKEVENLIVELIEKERLRKERLAQQERERKEKLARERAEKRERERLAQLEREKEIERLRKTKELEKVKAKEREIELANKKQAEEEKEYAEIEKPEPVEEPFAERKGKLMWPVAHGHVVAQYGNQVHPILKTITQNTGIDVSVPTGTPIKAIANGDIALIHWLPSYGNLIIINHNNGFRTVYAHLSEISVNVGQEVSEGDVIAKSGDTISGSLLHFELWKEKEKQNPELWLAHRKK